MGNRVFWGTRSNGMFSKQKSSLLNQNVDTLSVHLKWEGFYANEKGVSANQLKELDSDQNQLRFKFHHIFFGSQSALKTRYKLKEVQTEWIYTSENDVPLTNIPPGAYHLIVQTGINGHYSAKNQLTLFFEIHPPLYAKTWFKLLMVLIIAGMIYLFFRLRILVYNRDIVRELMRYLLKAVKAKNNTIVINEQGKEIRIVSDTILYTKSSGNYLEIHTTEKQFLIRSNNSNFLKIVPDRLEYLQVHRSYIVRIDRIKARGVKSIIVGNQEIPIGITYLNEVKQLDLN